MKIKDGKKYAVIAAICYAVFAVYNIIVSVITANKSDYSTITFVDVCFWVIAIGMAVALFGGKEKAVFIVLVFNALYYVYWFIKYSSIWQLSLVLPIVALCVLLGLKLNGNTIVKKIWFIPGAVMLIVDLVLWYRGNIFSLVVHGNYWRVLVFCVGNIPGIIVIVALFFAGMWIRDTVVPVSAKTAASTNEFATFNPQSFSNDSHSSDELGGADKLKMYKDLLDSGTITQEEFDAKKKQILGL